MPAPIVHAEIIGTDPDRLRGFYGALFGWDADAGDPVAAPVSAGDSYSFNPAGAASQPVPVGIGGGDGFAPRILFYVGVEDVATALDRALELGASVVVPSTPRPDGTLTVAQFADPAGNVVGLAGPGPA